MDLKQMVDLVVKERAARPGWCTSEFWGKCAVQLALTAHTVQPWCNVSGETAWIIIGGLEGLYLMWRSAIKARRTR